MNLRYPVTNAIMELTKAYLQQLPSAETVAQEKRLVHQYVAAIRSHVLQVARGSTSTNASFWIVDPVLAQHYLKNSSHLLYPWHHKSIGRFKSPLASGHLKRPIPVALVPAIREALEVVFPDCEKRIGQSPLVIDGQGQDLLIVDWS